MRYLSCLLLLLAMGCGQRPVEPLVPDIPAPHAIADAWFEDVAADSGIDFAYHNGEEADHRTILESLGGGIALLDYDRDGLLDIFVVGGGRFTTGKPFGIAGLSNKLYRNMGGWKFADVTNAAGVAGGGFYGHGAAASDYDSDGWTDLLVTGYAGLTLYRNNRGKFEDVTTKSGLKNPIWATSAAWGDLDGDGLPDLYLCQYVDWSPQNHVPCPSDIAPGGFDVCPPQQYKPLPHFLYRNKGDGTFEDKTVSCQIRSDGKGLGVLISDLDLDGRPDIYVANDATDNFLYLNRGPWKFEEVGVSAGVARDENGSYDGSMGVDAGDLDGSGRPSLLVTNFQDEWHALYRNLGGGRFLHQSQAMGLAALGRSFVGFGVAIADFNLDGLNDAVIAHGHVVRFPKGSTVMQLPVLMEGATVGDRRRLMRSASGGAYFSQMKSGRGLAVGDFDNNGRPDLVISHQNAPVALLRNRAPARDKGWVGVSGLKPGDRVSLVNSSDPVQFARGGGSYLSSSDDRLTIPVFQSGISIAVRFQPAWGGAERQIQCIEGKHLMLSKH